MPEAEAFLRTIIENPDDDAPRLIYADWLDENNDPNRAEFIRVQCKLAAKPSAQRREEVEERRALNARENELLDRHAATWIAAAWPLTQTEKIISPQKVFFQRGFIEEVHVESRTFVAGAADLFRLSPVRDILLYWRAEPPHERARFMQTVAGMPELARLRSLDLSHGFIGSDGTRALAVCDYLNGLESLTLLGCHIGERGLRALVEASWFGNLTFLDLRNNDVNAAAAHALATGLDALDRAGLLRLRELLLGENPLRTAGTRVIRSSAVLRRLVRL